MSIQSDRWIQKMARQHGMIEPFEERQVRQGISFGLASYGYDFRLGRKFRLLRPRPGDILNPKNFGALDFEEREADFVDIVPGSYCLGVSLEYFRIPRDILALCFGKSTYARSGVLVNVTPLEPEWEGTLTLAIANYGPLPARVYALEGIAQAVFLKAGETCAVSYADKKGKYQGQKKITGARI